MIDEQPDTTDLPLVIESACLAQCRAEGHRYTANVAGELVVAVERCRDPRAKAALVRLLAKVEALRDGEQLPLERERVP